MAVLSLSEDPVQPEMPRWLEELDVGEGSRRKRRGEVVAEGPAWVMDREEGSAADEQERGVVSHLLATLRPAWLLRIRDFVRSSLPTRFHLGRSSR